MGPFRVGASFGQGGSRQRGYRQEAPTLSSDHVYVIEGNGAVKIGVTSDLDARLATLQTGSPHPLNLAYSTRVVGDAYAVEAEAHGMLARHRLSGEWFAVPPDVAVAAINGAAFRLGGSIKETNGNFNSKRRWWFRFFWAVIFSLPFWFLAVRPEPGEGPIGVLYSILPQVILISRMVSKREGFGNSILWLFLSISGWIIGFIPAALLAHAFGWS